MPKQVPQTAEKEISNPEIPSCEKNLFRSHKITAQISFETMKVNPNRVP